MEIILNEKNFKKVEAMIEKVQNGCKVRCVTAQEIYDEAERIFKAVNISKAALQDCIFICDLNGQKFPNAYKYTPYSTIFTLVFKNGNFRLLQIERSVTNSTNKAIAIYTDKAKATILEKYSKV